MREGITINLDFDGTCVKHAFPEIGEDIGAIPVLKRLVAAGHKLILFTMRSNDTFETEDGIKTNTYLSDAIDWFKQNEIPLYGIQKNPTQHIWTSSPKSYAQMMIDDSALGCPLKYDYIEVPTISSIEKAMFGETKKIPDGRPYVDWVKVESMLVERGLILEEPQRGN